MLSKDKSIMHRLETKSEVKVCNVASVLKPQFKSVYFFSGGVTPGCDLNQENIFVKLRPR